MFSSSENTKKRISSFKKPDQYKNIKASEMKKIISKNNESKKVD